MPVIPTLNEYVERIHNSSSGKQELCLEALKYYNCVELWCMFADITGDWETGLEATKYNLAKSHLYWNKYIAVNASKVAFQSRLRIPHMEIDETMSLFSQFAAENLDNYEEEMSEATKIASATKKLLLPRERWELKLIRASVEVYVDYIAWERDKSLKMALFNRAVCDFPNEPHLWHQWIQFVWTDLKNEDEGRIICDRAIVLCPCDSIEATSVLLGMPRYSKKPQVLLSDLCVVLERVYSGAEKSLFIDAAEKALKYSSDIEFRYYVLAMMLVVDKEHAESLLSLKNEEATLEWLAWKRLALIPDISDYFMPILAMDTKNVVILREKLRGYLMLAMRANIDATRLQILDCTKAAQEKHSTTEKSESATPHRSREDFSLIVVGPVAKEKLFDTLSGCKINSYHYENDHHVIEMTSLEEKQRAIALISLSRELENARAYDAAKTTLWLANYPVNWSKKDIEKACQEFGIVITVRVPHTNGRRFCYVQLATSTDALKVQQGMEATYKDIAVKFSDPTARQDRTGPIEDGRQAYISGFDFNTNEKQLNAWIKNHSVFEPETIRIPASKKGRENDGYAFVVYASPEQAEMAVRQFETMEYAGRKLRASISRKKRRNENPHSLVIKNVYDENALRRLLNGEVKYEDDTHTAIVLFENEAEVGRAMLKVAGKELAGHQLQVQSNMKPQKLFH